MHRHVLNHVRDIGTMRRWLYELKRPTDSVRIEAVLSRFRLLPWYPWRYSAILVEPIGDGRHSTPTRTLLIQRLIDELRHMGKRIPYPGEQPTPIRALRSNVQLVVLIPPELHLSLYLKCTNSSDLS